jgi:hypothetical protein
MAVQDVLGDILFPPPPIGSLATYNFSSGAVIDAASEAGGTIFQIPKTGNVRKVHWGTRTVTTGATLDVRLEGIDATTGLPDGSLVGATTNGSQVVANADDNTLFATTLTADAAVTRGQKVALVISNPPASFGNMVLCAYQFGHESQLPYNALRQASWSKAISNFILAFALEYDDGSVVPITGIVPPSTTFNTYTVSTATTPDVVGIRFQLPLAARVIGGWTWIDDDGDYILKLVSTAYNQGAGTGILASVAMDKDIRRQTSSALALHYFTAAVDLAAATNYRLVVEPSSATSLSFFDLQAPSLAVLDAWHGGRNIHTTTAKDPTADGDWTNHNSGTFRRPFMGLIIAGFDDASGAVAGGSSRSRVQRRM